MIQKVWQLICEFLCQIEVARIAPGDTIKLKLVQKLTDWGDATYKDNVDQSPAVYLLSLDRLSSCT